MKKVIVLASLAEIICAMKPIVPTIDEKIKKESEQVVASDPYQEAHRLYANAETEGDFKKVAEEYNKEHKQSTEEQRAMAQTNRGEALLALGYIQQGFKDREARLRFPLHARTIVSCEFPIVRKPLSQVKDIQGKIIAVYCNEGGVGDQAQFARWLPALKRMGAKIHAIVASLKVKEFLANNCRRCVDEVIVHKSGYGPYPGVFDCDVHIMSLPCFVSEKGLIPTTFDTIPQEPWIDAEVSRRKFWLTQIGKKPKSLHVAYSCMASKMQPGVYNQRMLERDVPQDALEKILREVPNTTLYCIQGPGTKTGPDVINIAEYEAIEGEPFFGHTIALLSAIEESGMGLVVLNDSAPANIAAGIGRPGKKAGVPGYIMLGSKVDWRNCVYNDKTPSPFLASLQRLKQTKNGDWSIPLQELSKDLKKLALHVYQGKKISEASKALVEQQ